MSIPATPSTEARMRMIANGQSMGTPGGNQTPVAPPPLPPLPTMNVYPPSDDYISMSRPPSSSSLQPKAPSEPPPPLPPGTYSEPSPPPSTSAAAVAYSAVAMEKGEKSIIEDFETHAARDTHKIPYMVIASATIFFALIALGIGAAVSQRANWSVYGVWWSAFIIILAGVPGLVATLTGDLVSTEGNVWVIVTATASGVAAVVAIVNASIVGTYYMIFSGYNFTDSFLVASEVFIVFAAIGVFALHTYSVFIIGQCTAPGGVMQEPVVGVSGAATVNY